MKHLLLTALCLGSFLYADPLVHRVNVGPDLFWSHYRSGFDRDEDGMKLTATLNGYYAGARAGYDYLQPDALYVGTEGVIAWGQDSIHQHVSRTPLTTSCSRCLHSSHHHQYRLFATIEQRLGYNAQSTLFPQFIATPFLALGWHYESPSHAHAYWYYGAFGLKTIQMFYDRFELGIDLKVMYAFDIHDRGFASITTTQGKKTFWGLEAALPLRWLFSTSNRWDFEFKPYLLKFNLNSPQTIIGVRFLFGYSF